MDLILQDLDWVLELLLHGVEVYDFNRVLLAVANTNCGVDLVVLNREMLAMLAVVVMVVCGLWVDYLGKPAFAKWPEEIELGAKLYRDTLPFNLCSSSLETRLIIEIDLHVLFLPVKNDGMLVLRDMCVHVQGPDAGSALFPAPTLNFLFVLVLLNTTPKQCLTSI